MKFRLVGKKDSDKPHDGIMARKEAPPVVVWGYRTYLRAQPKDGVVIYKEVDSYRIGSI